MSRSLGDRFCYGNSGWVIPDTPGIELDSGIQIQNKEQKLIHLAREQVEMQRTACQEIAKSNLISAQLIAAEIEEQTSILDISIKKIGDNLSGSLSFAADQISDSIDMLGNRLAFELTEIRWKLAQQLRTLENVLEVLYKRRKYEARELVRQGLRHYVNGEIEEAEERFTKALKYDTTDYQVLLNLGFIEIHKGNAAEAFTFLKKALTLPEKLNPSAKARTLWIIARLFYAEKNFEKAFLYAKEASKYVTQKNPRLIYTLGIYAALSGDMSTALDHIKHSIYSDPVFFSKAAIDPDLETIKEEVFNLLGRLSIETESKAKEMLRQLEAKFYEVEGIKETFDTDNFITRARNHINTTRNEMQNRSYSTCIKCIKNMKILRSAISHINSLFPLYSQSKNLEKEFEDKNQKHSELKPINNPDEDPSIGLAKLFIILVMYILPGIFFANEAVKNSWNDSWGISLLMWPIGFIINFVGCLIPGNNSAEKTVDATLLGLLIGLVLSVAIWIMANKIIGDKSKEYKEIQKEISDSRKQLEEVKKELSNIQNKINIKKEKIEGLLAGVEW